MHLVIDNTFSFLKVWEALSLELGYLPWKKRELHRRGFTDSGVRNMAPTTKYHVSVHGRKPIVLEYTSSLKPSVLSLPDGSQITGGIPLHYPTRTEYLDHLDHVCAS